MNGLMSVRLRGLIGLVVVVVSLGVGASAHASGPLSWGPPAVLDNQPPYTDAPPVLGVSCPSVSFCAAVNSWGRVLTSVDPAAGWQAWQIVPVEPPHPVLPSLLPFAALTGVSCPSLALCVAVDAQGNVVSSTDPRGGSGAWRLVHVDAAPSDSYPGPFGGVSCPTVSLCVAVDRAGNVLVSTDPTGGASAWRITHVDGADTSLNGISCPSASLCVAVDGAGHVVTSTDPAGGAPAWTVSSVGQRSLLTISCASPNLCVAGDDNGNVVSSTDPAGGASAWAAALADTATYACGHYDIEECQSYLTAISCPSQSLCVGLDYAGNTVTSTDPAGGASAWQVTPITPNSPFTATTVSCATDSLCVAAVGKDVMTSTHPTGGSAAWTATKLEGFSPLTAASCPSASLCLALDQAGRVLSSTHPTDRTSAWNSALIAGLGDLSAVSCAPPLCVALSRGGRIFTSTNPTGPASAWTALDLPSRSFADVADLDGVSCPSVSLCVAVNFWGHVWTSRNPTGGAADWTKTDVESQASYPGIQAVSCASTSLCVAVDLNGNVLTSTNPTGGPSAWTVTHVADTSPGGLDSVSCPAISLCVAAGAGTGDVSAGNGDIFTSTAPARGAAAWRVTRLHHVRASYVSCASLSLCAAIAGSGTITSTNPTGGPSAWTVDPIDNDRPEYGLAGVSCTTAFCIVADQVGAIVVGTRVPPARTDQLRTMLRQQLTPAGNAARRASLLKQHGYPYSFEIPTAGRLVISWYSSPVHVGVRNIGRILVASAQAPIASYTTTKIKIRITEKGRRLLKLARPLKILAKASFTPAGKHTVLATSTLTILR